MTNVSDINRLQKHLELSFIFAANFHLNMSHAVVCKLLCFSWLSVWPHSTIREISRNSSPQQWQGLICTLQYFISTLLTATFCAFPSKIPIYYFPKLITRENIFYHYSSFPQAEVFIADPVLYAKYMFHFYLFFLWHSPICVRIGTKV